MNQITNINKLPVGTRVALLCSYKNGASVAGHKEDEPITISKIKEDGSVYLKGANTPTSVAFKENGSGAWKYSKRDKWTSIDYTIVSVEFAKDMVSRWNKERRVKKQFKEDIDTTFSIEEMEQISTFINALKKGKVSDLLDHLFKGDEK